MKLRLPMPIAALVTTALLAACGGSPSPGASTTGGLAAPTPDTPAGTGGGGSGANPGTGTDTSPGAGTGPGAETPPATIPRTRYDMANGCYALRSLAANAGAVRQADGSYALTAATTSAATPFYMKPTALGKYMFHARDATLLNAASGTVGSATTPTATSDWTVDTDATGAFTVVSAAAGQAQALVAANGKLALATTPTGDAGRFTFAPATGCTPFPEAQLNATGATYKGRGVDQPVLGFADTHNHLSATTFLGGAHYGAPFHPYGIATDLANCQAAHGPNGTKDLFGNVSAYGNPARMHSTVGWPTFADWPTAISLTHEGTYYKWVERAWLGGLRILVTNLVENETLCSIQRNANNAPTASCNEMANARGQAAFLYALQDYIDAQEGGPGKGWFRLVKSPAEARRVINDGKLAVVMGIEVSHLFNCTLTYDALGNEVPGCTRASIDRDIDDLFALGVRGMYPVHEFNNALAGNGIFETVVLNSGNRYDTGRFWTTKDCPATPPYATNARQAYNLGAVFTTGSPSPGADPLADLLQMAVGGTVPVYPSGRQCNARGLTDLGKYAVQRMMDKKMVIEIDHMEVSVKSDVLTLAEQQTPVYPVVSAHGGHGGITREQARRVLQGGGLVFPYQHDAVNWLDILNNGLKPLKADTKLFAMGYGADTNGLGDQAAACTTCKERVQYPFTMFRGAGWGPEFANVQPVTFDRQVTGSRVFDANIDGQATYGQKPDWVEQLRTEGGEEAISVLYRSAEAYLQMWERAQNR